MNPADLSPALVCAVLVLASYRLTRLAVADTIWGEVPETHDPPDDFPNRPAQRDHGTELRAMLDRRLIADDGEPLRFWRGKLAELIGCPWCTGLYLSLLTVLGWQYGNEAIQWGIIVAAVAGAQGFLSSRYDA